ncbi:MAG: molybdopterin-biosynthesis enzyme MoeA-like protein, partial [Kiritimatiellia bacterium]
RYDHVFTSGGVGPTHDDMTFLGVAHAFDVELVAHPELVDLLSAAGLTNDAAMRMALVPDGAELVYEEASRFPTVRMRNIWVLPGVPKLFQMKFELVSHHFQGQPVFAVKLYTVSRETEIAEHMTRVQAAIPQVDIGSYPRFGEGPWKVIITIDGRDEAFVDQAVSMLRRDIEFLDLQDST